MSQSRYFAGIAIRVGVLEYFDLAYELCRRLIARWLNKNVSPGIADEISMQHLLRLAAESQLIQDVDQWIQYDERRTATTRAYDFDKAGSTCNSMGEFVQDAHEVLHTLESRNG